MTTRIFRRFTYALGWRLYLLSLLFLLVSAVAGTDALVLNRSISGGFEQRTLTPGGKMFWFMGFWLFASFVALPLFFVYRRLTLRLLYRGKGRVSRFLGKVFLGITLSLAVGGVALVLLVLVSSCFLSS